MLVTNPVPQLTQLYLRPLLLLLLLLLPQITEPYLQIYRGILPPLFGQLDFTPLFGFLILQVGGAARQLQ
jgi:uncharacterized protein YggT (Ycf19 family)